MNRSLLGRIMPLLLGFYALSLVVFFIYALAIFSATTYLPSMRWSFALYRAIGLFIEYLLPIQTAAIAMAASLAGRGAAATGPSQPWNRIVSSTLVVFLLLTAAYAVLYEGFAPGIQKRLIDMRYQSQLARTFMEQAKAAGAAGDYQTALDALDRYLSIDASNADAISLRLTYEPRAARRAAGTAKPLMVDTAGSDAQNAEALMVRARAAADKNDWFTAHFFAQKAAALDPRRTDALALAAKAWDQIGNVPVNADAKTAAQFAEKKAAYQKLVAGDALGAYYDLLTLASRYPKDADIATYLGEASAEVQKSSFFLDDAKRLLALPGTQSILFFDPGTGDGPTMREAVSIGKMVVLPAGDAYFFDIEAIRYDAAGTIVWHFSAPYGRREGSTILMHCIDRNDPSIHFLPTYTPGSQAPAQAALLAIAPTVGELQALSTSRENLAVMGLPELWSNHARLATFGVPEQALTVDIVMKIVMPFAFLVLSLLAVSLGWAFRARFVGRIPLPSLILTPLIPIMCALLSLLYLHAHRILAGFAVLSFGFTTALVVVGVLELILLGHCACFTRRSARQVRPPCRHGS